MPTSLYPQSPTDFAALMAAVLPFATWAVTGLVQALNASTKRGEGEWIRLHQLAEILYNGKQYGLWQQILAVQELERLKTRRTEAKELAERAEKFWSADKENLGINQELIKALREFTASNEFDLTKAILLFFAGWMIAFFANVIFGVAKALLS